MSQPFTCFHCGDGNTPLYCLNCANDQLNNQLAAATQRAEQAEAQCVRATMKLDECRQLIRDYKTAPNGGTYGAYQGWLDRAEHALSDDL